MTKIVDPSATKPPDDSGSDTFARYKYQAEVTFPFCLHAALGDELLAVIPEHFEDIALEYDANWRFIQIKSRNPERGLWKLSDITDEGGALRSLYRTYCLLGEADYSLELILEGTPKSKDIINNLKAGGNHTDAQLLKKVSESLKIDETEARRFLAKVVLNRPPTSRPDISDINVRLVQHHNKALDIGIVETLYGHFISRIEQAMQAKRLGPKWPAYVMGIEKIEEKYTSSFQAKRLDAKELKALAKPLLVPPRPLLSRIIDNKGEMISVCEAKMQIGGATDELVHNARDLWANAQKHLQELSSQGYSSFDEKIEDLHKRLEMHASAKNAIYQGEAKPAIHIWDSLLELFTSNASGIDSNNLLATDPMLLLGEVCELSSRCKNVWGTADAK